MSLASLRPALAAALTLLPVVGAAHAGHGGGAGFGGSLAAGLLHPVLGPDHLLAMVAVGLWGAFLGTPAIWLDRKSVV